MVVLLQAAVAAVVAAVVINEEVLPIYLIHPQMKIPATDIQSVQVNYIQISRLC